MIEFLAHIPTQIHLAAAAAGSAITQSPAFALEVFIYASIGGVLPALLWLWFWMHENHEHDEPKSALWLTFVVGMATVFIVYPLQKLASVFIGDPTHGWSTLFVWALLEEIVKYLAAYLIALRLRHTIFDEPIDAFVYLMTAALGFSAMENTLFLMGPLLQGETIETILTGNLRFMGANLLHVASSGVLSLCIAYTYFKPVWMQRVSVLLGIGAATFVHAIFNLSIVIISEYNKEMIFLAFSYVWITLIILILALEKVKKIKEF